MAFGEVLGLSLLWGAGFLWIKLALRGFSPVQIVFVRLLVGAVILGVVALAARQRFPRDRRTWGHLAVAALVANAVPYVLFGIGERTVGSNVAGLINATTPLWTLLFAFAAGTDRSAGPARVGGFALGFAGTVVMFAPWKHAGEFAGPGGLAILAAALCYGISYVYMARYLTGRGLPPLVLAAGQLLAGSALLALALPVAGLDPPTWRADAVLSLACLGVLGTAAAYVLNYRIIAAEGPAVASTVTYLLPVVAVGLGWLVLGETLTPSALAGIALVLAGVALTRRR
ncbi:multidrug transporter [Pilimelia anulata]|uniref:Multidrug transporter n=1 Tax=Pilimelia anulata TaxID=53371 RepID=A0A8J3B506_9ACTN|nr:multidrug transporter [Pilimelia anulata]